MTDLQTQSQAPEKSLRVRYLAQEVARLNGLFQEPDRLADQQRLVAEHIRYSTQAVNCTIPESFSNAEVKERMQKIKAIVMQQNRAKEWPSVSIWSHAAVGLQDEWAKRKRENPTSRGQIEGPTKRDQFLANRSGQDRAPMSAPEWAKNISIYQKMRPHWTGSQIEEFNLSVLSPSEIPRDMIERQTELIASIKAQIELSGGIGDLPEHLLTAGREIQGQPVPTVEDVIERNT